MNGLKELIIAFGKLVSLATVIMAGVALLVFFWGLARFIFQSGDPKTHEQGKNIMVWGIISLFVMVSVWGIIFFMQRSLGINMPSDNVIDPFNFPGFPNGPASGDRNT